MHNLSQYYNFISVYPNISFGNDTQVPELSADMPVSADEITAFYGYYTLDIERHRKIVGMMSVNGFTRQVFPHT